jgi:hypothetical protein
VNKRIGGYLLAFFLLLGVTALTTSTVQAQYPGDYGRNRDDRYRRDRDRDRDYDRNDRNRNDRYGRGNNYGYQLAREQGYRDGLSTGASDAQRGQSFSPQRSHYWQNGTDGYNSSYGNKGQYKQVFREAFDQGYREGFQRYGYNRGGNNGRRGNNGRGSNGRWPW